MVVVDACKLDFPGRPVVMLESTNLFQKQANEFEFSINLTVH